MSILEVNEGNPSAVWGSISKMYIDLIGAKIDLICHTKSYLLNAKK